MNRHCQKCHSEFQLEPPHLELLEKLAPSVAGQTFKIPPPTLCPDCRKQRRLSFRNDLSLYDRKSSMSSKRIFSIYPEHAPFPVFENSEWWSDSWDPLAYGRPFNFSRTFFDQFIELQRVVPRVNLYVDNLCVNCNYSNQITLSKNCYLLFSGSSNDECHYSYRCNNSRNCIDCLFILESELCYECVDVFSSYNCKYSQLISNCSDSAFLFDCHGCQSCLFCSGLRNKAHHIFNRPSTPAQFEAELAELRLNSRSGVEKARLTYLAFIRDFPRKFANLKQTENVTGDNIQNAKNCSNVFDGANLEDVHYAQFVQDTKDVMDANYCCDQTELHYEVSTSGINAYRILFSVDTWPIASDLLYCDSCSNGTKDCFGCIGLRSKQYCILNKQYPKAEYLALLPQIISHMQRTGEWGEFFPMWASPFCYNESTAQQFFPLSREEVHALNLPWREETTKTQKQAVDAPDLISEAGDQIVNQALACRSCARNYRITSQELSVYSSNKIPLPSNCFFCRHASRMKQRPPRKLWKRVCSCCEAAVETPCPEDSSVKILCEGCYEKEVYG